MYQRISNKYRVEKNALAFPEPLWFISEFKGVKEAGSRKKYFSSQPNCPVSMYVVILTKCNKHIYVFSNLSNIQGVFFDWSPQKSLSIEILYENT